MLPALITAIAIAVLVTAWLLWRFSRGYDRDNLVAARQEKLRAQIAPASVDDTAEVLFLATGSGEILQLLPPDADDATQSALDANTDDA